MSSSDAMLPRKTARKDSALTKHEDRISNLPDEVIDLIIPKLSTVEAVATSVLSKHWKSKWPAIRDIEVNDRRRPVPTGESSLIAFLERLIRHMGDVRSASLELRHEYDSGGVERFISELLKRSSLKKLHIETTQKIILPDSLFGSTSLKELVLIKGPVFKLPSNHSFANLTSLCLRDLAISNEVLDEDYDGFVFNFPVLENLEVSCCKYDSGGLERFISELLKRTSVKKLHIETTQKIILPDSIFNSTSLKELVLVKGPVFKVPSNQCFANLTSLCLRDLAISNEVLDEDYENFVFNFPVLENLEISCCMWYDVRYSNIHIRAPALKTFTSETRSNDNIEFYNITIHDAKLEDFSIKGCEPESFSLTGTQVVCASLQCVIDNYPGGAMKWSGLRIRSFLKDIAPTLEKLYVSVYVAEAILESRLGRIPLPRFDKLRTLLVVDGIHLTNTEAVFEILHATPFLECLNIDAMFWDEYDYDSVESVPWCITNSLEEIGLYNIMGTKGTFQLAQFLLKTAAKLKVCSVDCFGDNGIPLEEAKSIISGYPTASLDVTFK